MNGVVQTRAALRDLACVEGKAELISGSIVRFMASGDFPATVAANIYVSLRQFVRNTGRGRAYADGIGFAVPELSSGRESFSPDASYYDGPHPANRMRFIEGVPQFAAEVCGENDYGPAAELEMRAKRAVYFEAGALVVWDVDPKAETVAAHRAEAPDEPILFRRGDEAHAEPAVPGWRMSVADVFEE